VQIWFPNKSETKSDYLKFGEFKPKALPLGLTGVYEALKNQMDSIFIRDAVKYNIQTGQELNHNGISDDQVLKLINETSSRAKRASIKKSMNFPVIIYHHGSQGLSYENSIMAEYFASRGYIFISANFHLPYENTVFGLLPYQLEIKRSHDQSQVKALINFARTLSEDNQIFYVGHSWGAQEGWCFLDDPKWADAFVSLETTLEFGSDSMKIKEYWPDMYHALIEKRNTFLIPILAFAAQEPGTNFEIFRGLNSEDSYFLAYKKPFSHNSYISMLYSRLLINDEIRQPDEDILLSQLAGYLKHLKVMDTFFNSVLSNTKFSPEEFEDEFILH
jgi:hypothetical protein